MKKLLLIILILAIMLITACGQKMNVEYNNESPSMFTVVENGNNYVIVYHTKTKVMYAISDGGYNSGDFNLLVDADGNPLIWRGEQE